MACGPSSDLSKIVTALAEASPAFEVEGLAVTPSGSSSAPISIGSANPSRRSIVTSTLAGFPGMSVDHDTLDKLAERWRDRAGHR